MKLVKTLSMLLMVCVFLVPNHAHAQDLAGKKSTIVQFDFILFESLLKGLDPYEPSTLREKENYKEAKQYVQKVLIDKLYEEVTSKLLSEKEINMEPLNALEDHSVLYNNQGYPNTIIAKSVIKKVKKKGYESDLFFAIKTSVEAAPDILGKAKLSKQVKDLTKVVITVFDGNGTKIEKYEGSFKAEEPKKAKSFPSSRFDKMDVGYMDLLVEMLLPGMQEAVDEAIESMTS